ncbi:hypothetical protein SHIRM173S_02958 [Streptomyces hirsutus]
MVEVGQVEDLEVDAPGADLGVAADLVDDLGGGARQPVGPQLVGIAADRGGPAGDLLFVLADAGDQRVGVHEGIRVAAGLLGGGAHPAELALAVLEGGEGHVELVGVPRGEPGCADGAVAADERRDLGLGRLGERRGRVRS